MSIGSSPVEETCAQVGQADYFELAQAECKRFLALLIKVHGEPPFGARLHIHANPHDFGTYYEVCVAYDDASEIATDYALKLEGDTPSRWTD